jgi:serine/threonine-protein kinase
VDGRADQYSLGVVGHHILTGKQPFDGSSHSILYKHVFEPPPRIFEIRPDAPADLCAALDRALSKEPERRFPSMEEFAAAVSGDRTGPRTVVSAAVKPIKAQSAAAGKPRQHRLLQRSLIAGALCAVLGGVAWALLPYRSGDRGSTTPRQVRVLQPRPSPNAAPPAATAEPGHGAGSTRPKPVKKEYGLLTVASEPWGTLYLGNKEVGPTPIADYPLPIGTHRIRIEQEGYRTKVETIEVTGPNPIRRRYLLEPMGPP